ncbi:MAG: amidohydrolase family protein [Ignavibacteriaceae bacterium]
MNNLNIVGKDSNKYSIEIKDQKIVKVVKSKELKNTPTDETINFANVLAFPGIINSHDHLEFNLFPKLGNKKYQDYVEWGEDIHQKNSEIIQSVLKIPLDLRIKFGIYKNLLCGITTIIHHGNMFDSFNNEIIDIQTGGAIIHSVQLEKNWKLKLNNPINFEKILIHTGEGNNENSKTEIDELIKWNLLNKKLIGIHAIGMNEKQAKHFNAIIWCPASNFFLYGKTTDINLLKTQTKILFGTDSTTSADWNFWEHLRLAKKLNFFDDFELFNSVTKNSAEVFNLKNTGELKENYFADIIIAKKKIGNIWEAFYSVNPEDIILILKKGKTVLFDEEISKDIKPFASKKFYKFNFKNKTKFTLYDINESIEQAKSYNPEIIIPFL